MSLHKDLTGTDIHEPKGLYLVDVEGQVYSSDGLGSGSWGYPYAAHGACMRINASSTKTTVTNITVTNVVTGWESVYTRGDMTVATNTVTLPYIGSYEVQAVVCVANSNVDASVYEFDLAVNGVLQNFPASAKVDNTATNIVTVPLCGVITTQSENSALGLTIYHSNGDTNVTVTDAVIVVKSL